MPRRRRSSRVKEPKEVDKSNDSSSSDDFIVLPVNPKQKYQNGDIVWARFDSYPWWPGKVRLKNLDNGKHDINIVWIGDFNQRSDRCKRNDVVPFERKFKRDILVSVEEQDEQMFLDAVKEAYHVQKELKQERGEKINESESESEQSDNDEEDSQEQNSVRRSSRQRNSNNNNNNIDDEKNSQTPTPEKRRSKRLAKKKSEENMSNSSQKSTRNARKRKREPEIIINNNNNLSPTILTRSKRNQRNKKRNIILEHELTNKERKPFTDKRKHAYDLVTTDHSPEDLSNFIAFEYNALREYGFTDIEAKEFLTNIWQSPEYANITDHLIDFNKKYTKNKRRRKN